MFFTQKSVDTNVGTDLCLFHTESFITNAERVFCLFGQKSVSITVTIDLCLKYNKSVDTNVERDLYVIHTETYTQFRGTL